MRFALRAIIVLLAATVLFSSFPALAAKREDTLTRVTRPPEFTAWPRRTQEGFLASAKTEPQPPFVVNEGETAGGEKEFVHRDPKNGQYIYLSKDLAVHIRRFTGWFNRKKIIWYLSDIRFAPPQHFRAYLANPARARVKGRPAEIALREKLVYAQNGDLFAFRMENKERAGLIIRNGKVIGEETYTKPVAKIPPLDELSLYEDGHIEMRTPGLMSAQQYLEAGALDVLAFGPVLLKDGQKDSRLDTSFTHREPRSAIGVIAPGHFVGIMVEGRNKQSAGVPLRFVAERLLEAGCSEAFTLDGGQTAAMLFMGEYVMSPGVYNGFHKVRRQQDVIGIGSSQLVGVP